MANQTYSFLGEIRMFSGNFAPSGWAFCNGQLLSISQNTALFALLGTTYGGDGRNNFALPNLQARTPLHPGQGQGLSPYQLGQQGGEPRHTLTTSEMPAHVHTPQGVASAGTTNAPGGNLPAQPSGGLMYKNSGSATAMLPTANAGSSQPHNNRQPYLGISFIIALQGIFPPRS